MTHSIQNMAPAATGKEVKICSMDSDQKKAKKFSKNENLKNHFVRKQ